MVVLSPHHQRSDARSATLMKLDVQGAEGDEVIHTGVASLRENPRPTIIEIPSPGQVAA